MLYLLLDFNTNFVFDCYLLLVNGKQNNKTNFYSQMSLITLVYSSFTMHVTFPIGGINA